MKPVLTSMALSLILLLRSGPSFALDPRRSITQYVHASFGLSEGLPQSSVYSVAQTADGYLWIATAEGLARFDGTRFVVYDKSNTEGLHSSWIVSLMVDSRGTLWIGTRGGGVTRYERGRFEAYAQEQGLTNPNVTKVIEDRKGRIWSGTLGGGLFVRERDRFAAVNLPSEQDLSEVHGVIEDGEGRMWIATNRGVYHFVFEEDEVKDFEAVAGLESVKIQLFLEDSRGAIWIGTNGEGLFRLQKGALDHFGKDEGIEAARILSAFEDSDGLLWFGTREGLYRFNQGRFTSFGTAQGLMASTVLAIFEDAESNLWVGTVGGGLDLLRDGKFVPYDTQVGLSHDFTLSMCEDPSGTLWVGTYGGGLNRYRKGTFSVQPLSKDATVNIGGLACAPSGEVWVGTYRSGLFLVRGDQSVAFPAQEALSNTQIRVLFLDAQSRLWIGTSLDGLYMLKGEKLEHYTKNEGLPSNSIVAIAQTRSGDLWLGSEAGLSRFRAGAFETFTTKDGLASDSVFSLYCDSDDRLWVGTYGGGLALLQGEKLKVITARDGLANDVVYSIVEDGQGSLWFTSNKGVSTTKKAELLDFTAGKISKVHSVHYGSQDGLKSPECNGGVQPSGVKRTDGSLVFPTLVGFVSIDPAAILVNRRPPKVQIEDVVADAAPLPLASAVVLPAQTRRLEIRYTGLSFVDSEEVSFKYMLEGFDTTWVENAGRRVAYYTNLGPGSYRFRVVAANSDGVWNELGASLQLKKLPHFYETAAFRFLVAVVFLLLVYGIVVWRVGSIKRRNRELENLVKERTAKLEEAYEHIVKLEKETLERQMAGGFAHEMRNALTAAHLTLKKILHFTSDGQSLTEKQAQVLGDLFKQIQPEVSDETKKGVALKLKQIRTDDKQLDVLVSNAHLSDPRGAARRACGAKSGSGADVRRGSDSHGR
ncbi:MAG: hypothetical protein MUC50_17550 [Myxococcota bacterium]|nr:hypothetical protein [Myxococcota bacterium]